MIPEIGQFALIVALLICTLQAILPTIGIYRNDQRLMAVASSAAMGQFLFVAIAFACLVLSFLANDFSVAYVMRQSNAQLPWFYQVSAVWGAHEGSFLLWTLIMAGWSLSVAAFSRSLPAAITARVLVIMALLSIGFLLFLIITSNPFERILPFAPTQGRELNPVLQDFGLIIHPPMLYMGYVGFSVAFSFAIAALWSGQLDSAWARWSRPWTTVAWAFLTLGIVLGSWWAYYELGWGGWWFWDAVENASFMPWLVGTALIHSLAVTEKRGVFKSWTVLLAIFAFSLSLLGAFIVRSGVLNSVHAFAQDPLRGQFILFFLLLVVGGSLLLYALRAPVVKSHIGFSGWSRETWLLINNVLLVVACAIVLLGTLFPLAYEAATMSASHPTGKKISVGPPYFNTVFVPVVILITVALVFGPLSRWKRGGLLALWQRVWKLLILAVFFGVGMPLIVMDAVHPYSLVALTAGAWLFGSLLLDLWQKVKTKASIASGLASLPLSFWGMWMAHLGLAFSIFGICMTLGLSEHRSLRMAPGEKQMLGGYEFHMLSVKPIKGPNYEGQEAFFRVTQDGEKVVDLYPQKRRYPNAGNVTTEAAIDPGLSRDLYIALGEPLEGDAWSVRLDTKPYVRWLWLGGLFMAFGGFTSVFDKRYRSKAVTTTAATETSAATGSLA